MPKIHYVGNIGILDALPFLKLLRADIRGLVNLVLPDIKARIDGLTKLSLQIRPPGFHISLAEKIVLALKASVVPPGIAFNASLGVLAELRLLLAKLELMLDIVFLPGDVHFFVYSGKAQDMGSAVHNAIQSGQINIPKKDFIIAPCLAVDPANVVAFTSLKTLFKMPDIRVNIE